MIFLKCQTPINKGEGCVHTMYVNDSLYTASTWYKSMCPPFLKTAVVSEIFYFILRSTCRWTKRINQTCGQKEQ